MILLTYKLMCDFMCLFINVQSFLFIYFFYVIHIGGASIICRLEDCGAFKSDIDSTSYVIGGRMVYCLSYL